MTNAKTFFLSAITLLLSLWCNAQNVSVKKEAMRVKNENAEGYHIVLDGKEINSVFIKYLKNHGKLKQGFDFHTLTESTLNGKMYTSDIYAISKENENNVEAWIGINTKEWSSDDAATVSKELEKMMLAFGVQYYRDKIQLQIDESNRALQAVEKQQQRLASQNRDLNTRLEDNKREKVQLEKSIETNKFENESLLKKIEQNKKDQDSVQIANSQIKKIIDIQKAKQQDVGSN
jgi:hypothetical protein